MKCYTRYEFLYLYAEILIKYHMGNRFLKIFYAVFMAILLVAVLAFTILHVMSGLQSGDAKLFLAGYILILIWASVRLYSLIKDLRR